MDKSKTYNNTNSGVLWAIPKKKDGKPEFSLIQRGKLNIDGNEMRIVGISRFNKDGERMVGIYREIGTIKKNNLKSGEKDPDAKGVVNNIVDNGGYTISAWKEEYGNGEEKNNYTSLKVRAFDSAQPDSNKNKYTPSDKGIYNDIDTSNLDTDEIPF